MPAASAPRPPCDAAAAAAVAAVVAAAAAAAADADADAAVVTAAAAPCLVRLAGGPGAAVAAVATAPCPERSAGAHVAVCCWGAPERPCWKACAMGEVGASYLFHDGRGKAAGAIQAFLGDKAITGSRVEDTIKSRRLYNSGHDS